MQLLHIWYCTDDLLKFISFTQIYDLRQPHQLAQRRPSSALNPIQNTSHFVPILFNQKILILISRVRTLISCQEFLDVVKNSPRII